MAVKPHSIAAKVYVNAAHRDSDLMWQSTRNLNRVVKTEDDDAFYVLASVGPTVWQSVGDEPHGAGYGFYLDDKFTAGTGQTVATHATDYTDLIVNGVGGTEEVNPSDLILPMFDVATNKVTPIKLNDMLNVRIQFTAANYSGPSPYIEVQMNAGGTSGAFVARTIALLKAGDDQRVLLGFSAFVGADWLANGGLIQIRYDGTGSVDLFNKAVQVQRTFSF